jgi:hypothetical protein
VPRWLPRTDPAAAAAAAARAAGAAGAAGGAAAAAMLAALRGEAACGREVLYAVRHVIQRLAERRQDHERLAFDRRLTGV